jgi:hypothetical protein
VLALLSPTGFWVAIGDYVNSTMMGMVSSDVMITLLIAGGR